MALLRLADGTAVATPVAEMSQTATVLARVTAASRDPLAS
jgi:hypothetical protein